MKKKPVEILVKECFENSDYKKRNNNVVKIVARLIASCENIER